MTKEVLTEGWLFGWPMKVRHYIFGGKTLCGEKFKVLSGDSALLRQVPDSMRSYCCAKCWDLVGKRKGKREEFDG